MSLIGQWCGPCLRVVCGARHRVATAVGVRVDFDKGRRLLYSGDGSGVSAVEPPEFWSRLPYPATTPEELVRYQEARISLEHVREVLVCAAHGR